MAVYVFVVWGCEYVRVSGDEFVYQPVADFVDVERVVVVVCADLRLEYGLQQCVAEFLAYVGPVVGFDGVDVFVGFLQ